ncbi:MAG: hypothetical protein A2902_02095 [Elusimicrobia bacterium RIFCSPLOWO2_01_FULL_64_13]|nr:MAG: hypothetical protein A2902_02095 [Elusimicrobia bacterium RIFCSPLOWO2_01_FULL_64_13]
MGSRGLASAAVLFGLASLGSAEGRSHVAAALLSEAESVQPGRPVRLGVRLAMEEGWHVYWENPGDSGLPTEVLWKAPEGFRAGPVIRPAPEIFGEPPVVNYGHDGTVLLVSEMSVPSRIRADGVTVAARVEWLECRDVCLPGRADLSIRLPVRPRMPAPSPENAEIFRSALSNAPVPPDGWEISAERSGGGLAIFFRPAGKKRARVRGAYFFSRAPGSTDPSARQRFSLGGKGYALACPFFEGTGHVGRADGVLVLYGAGGRREASLSIDVPVSP